MVISWRGWPNETNPHCRQAETEGITMEINHTNITLKTQVTGWSYYLWVLDVYPMLAEMVEQMMKEEEEE